MKRGGEKMNKRIDEIREELAWADAESFLHPWYAASDVRCLMGEIARLTTENEGLKQSLEEIGY